MRLGTLIEDLPILAPAGTDTEIRGITHDSRRVSPGDLFVALAGEHFDGRAFIPEAVDRGAVAVLGPGAAPAEINVPWLSTDDPRQVLGPLAAALYDQPQREMLMVGVTGTNGKSTVVHLVAAMLEAAGRPSGTLGTLGYRFRQLGFDGSHTTPEATDLFAVLRRMRDAGAAAVTMEVSSHALEMGRVGGAQFDLAVFTNLTRDHFDFHGDFESYFAAKRRLFGLLSPEGTAVVNIDDSYGRRLADELPRCLTFGGAGEVRAQKVQVDEAGIRGTIMTPRGMFTFETPLVGSFNLENVTAACAAAEALELEHAATAAALAGFEPLPGRLEPVSKGQKFPVYIDYAHTDRALEAAIRSVRELSQRQLIVVFGCGGDRDAGKRPLMGRIAGELADFPIVTSDNPRHENPMAIIEAVEEGLRQSGNRRYQVIPDRREAIHKAIAAAGPDSAVLVAGKGHERVQIIGDSESAFSDRAEIEAALEGSGGAGSVG